MKHVVAFLGPFMATYGTLVAMPELAWHRALCAAFAAGVGGLLGKEGNAWAKRRKR